MKKPMLLSVLLLLFISCAKRESISGRVTNYDTGEPIEGVAMTLRRVRVFVDLGWSGIGKNKDLGRVLTNTDGEFSFRTRVKNNEKYDYELSVASERSMSLVDSIPDIEEVYFVRKPYGNITDAQHQSFEECSFEVMPAGRLKVIPVDLPPKEGFEWFQATAGDTSVFDQYDAFDSNMPQPSYARIPAYKTVYVKYRYVTNGLLFEGQTTTTLTPFMKNVVYVYH